jgi:uncharacterized protein (DUF1330 family)
MSAYLIFTRDKTLDAQELTTYSKEVPATLAGHEANLLVLYGSHEDLEGAATEGTVILEFPSMDAAKAGTTAPPIAKCASIVSRGADYHVILVKGV